MKVPYHVRDKPEGDMPLSQIQKNIIKEKS